VHNKGFRLQLVKMLPTLKSGSSLPVKVQTCYASWSCSSEVIIL